jgi:F-type H+-transporting ATPase subunit alpha
LDADTKARIDSGRRLTEVLKQGKGVPLPFERQVVVIYTGVNGYLAGAPVEQISVIEEKLLQFLDREYKEIFSSIREARDITEETEGKLKAALESFVETHSLKSK